MAYSYIGVNRDVADGYPVGRAGRPCYTLGVRKLGDRIREIRKARRLSQAAVAAGVSAGREGDIVTKASTISQYETGERTPSVEMLEAIARVLDISPAEFWTDEPYEEPGRPVSESRSGTESTYRLDTMIRDASGAVRGPIALRYAAHDETTRNLARRVGQEAGRRAGSSDARSVSLAGVPRGSDLIDVRVPIVVRDGGAIVDWMGPGWVLVVEPGERPASPDEDLVIAALDADPDAEVLEDKCRLFHYREDRGVGFLWPLDFDPAGVVNTSQGWRVVGRVVERRKAASVDGASRP